MSIARYSATGALEVDSLGGLVLFSDHAAEVERLTRLISLKDKHAEDVWVRCDAAERRLAEAREALAWREYLFGQDNTENRSYGALPEVDKERWRKRADAHIAELIRNGAFGRAALGEKGGGE